VKWSWEKTNIRIACSTDPGSESQPGQLGFG
jgi:hypothetical protein